MADLSTKRSPLLEKRRLLFSQIYISQLDAREAFPVPLFGVLQMRGQQPSMSELVYQTKKIPKNKR